MKQIRMSCWVLIAVLFFGACRKDTRSIPGQTESTEDETAITAERGSHSRDHKDGPGRVYTMTNQAMGNKVLVYHRAGNGMLTWKAAIPTGGNGTGGGLGNQGAVVLDKEKKWLLVVNAGSNSLSLFQVTQYGLRLKSTVHSGGIQPVSVTIQDQIAYVLNAGGDGNISGFWISRYGQLHPIPHSTRPLSSNAAGAAQIEFVHDGKVLVITEKATNKIITYTVNRWGRPGIMHMMSSSNPTPFGFAPGKRGIIVVSEAVGGAPGASTVSSYRIGYDGSISLVSGPVGANQTAACWVVITNNGRYAFITNTGSNNVSTFGVNIQSGNLSVKEAISGNTEGGPIDAALSKNSGYLYVLNSGGNSLNAFDVGNDGNLSPIQVVSGLPAGANGLAAE